MKNSTEKMTNTKKEKLKRALPNEQPFSQEKKKKKTDKPTATANKTESNSNSSTPPIKNSEIIEKTEQKTTTNTINEKTSANDNNQDEEILSTKIPFIQPSQIDRAVTSLIDYTNKSIAQNSNDGHLFADQTASNQSLFHLVITLKRILGRPKHKPTKISLAHPLYDPRITPVCLMVKDPQREYKDLLEEQGIHFISKVVGLTKLKGKHSSYEARKLLLNSHALFLADERIIPSLPGILGSKFFQSNRLPTPVDLTSPTKIKSELEKAISNSSLRIGSGSCLTIKFADVSRHNQQEISENLVKVLEQLGKKIPLGGWRNIQSVHIKTGTSTSLPIWVAELGQDSPFSRFNMNHTAEEIKKIQAAEEKKQADKQKREANKKRLKRMKISNKIKV